MTSRIQFCTHCGHRMGVLTVWPAVCPGCNRKTYRNPTPVAVALVPVRSPAGLLTIRRGNEPGRGLLALPGGFVDWQDTSWQDAVSREVFEETGLSIPESNFRLFDVISAPDKNVLIFAISDPIDLDASQFVPTSETTEIVVVAEPLELAFSTHTEVVARYFAQ